MMNILNKQLFSVALCLPILGGCSYWSGPTTERASIPLGEPIRVFGRSENLQQQIAAMDDAAFGSNSRVRLTLKLSYKLGSLPRGT